MWSVDYSSGGLGQGAVSVRASRPRGITCDTVPWVKEGEESEGCGLPHVTSYTYKERLIGTLRELNCFPSKITL